MSIEKLLFGSVIASANGLASGILISIASICITSSAYAQTTPQVIAGGMSLSQQTLQDMQPGGASVVGGSMQVLSFQKDVKLSPVENIKNILDWFSGKSTGNLKPQGVSTEAMNSAITDFKAEQKTTQSTSISRPFR